MQQARAENMHREVGETPFQSAGFGQTLEHWRHERWAHQRHEQFTGRVAAQLEPESTYFLGPACPLSWPEKRGAAFNSSTPIWVQGAWSGSSEGDRQRARGSRCQAREGPVATSSFQMPCLSFNQVPHTDRPPPLQETSLQKTALWRSGRLALGLSSSAPSLTLPLQFSM